MSSPKEGQEIEQKYTHTQRCGWKGERGRNRLIITRCYSMQALLHHSQSYTVASHLELERGRENDRKRGRMTLRIAANIGEIFLALPVA